MKNWEWNPGDIGHILLAPIIMAIAACASLPVFSFVANARWNPLYWTGLALSAVGLTLLFIARMPLYREKKFFVWGSRALPETSRRYYRWAYCLIVPGAALLILFLLIAEAPK